MAFGGFVAMIGCGSASKPAKPPAPQVQRASPQLVALSIHVHRLITPPQTPEDHWDYKHMSGLTRGLREAFQVALIHAGYRVVVGRRDPRDLVATVQADWPHERAGVASLTITAKGKVVDQLSAVIPIIGKPPRTTHLDEHAAVNLVHALNSSAALAEYARTRAAPAPVQIAEPAPTPYFVPQTVVPPPPPPATEPGEEEDIYPIGF